MSQGNLTASPSPLARIMAASASISNVLLLLPALSPCPISRALTSRFRRSPLPLRRSFHKVRGPSRLPPVVVAAQSNSNFFRVIQTAWRIGKDVTEAGTKLVPDVVPRPLARIGVAVAAGTVALILFKSFLSTAFFVLAMMGFIYFVFIALNTDESSRGDESSMGGGSTASTEDDTLEEARRIMEKYK